MNHYYKKAPEIATRFVITGRLKLLRPASFSNGDRDGLTSIELRRDVISNKPVLPGTSLAGAMRHYLMQQIGTIEPLTARQVNRLFGFNDKKSGESHHSWLFIDDALGESETVELRDGVTIDRETRTAADKKKYETEFLAAGTTFGLRLEFWEPLESGFPLRQLLALALQGLEKQDEGIALGGRKRRGFGECTVEDWHICRYSMRDKHDILRWLEADNRKVEAESLPKMLGVDDLPELPSAERFKLKATLDIEGSLLIRSMSKDPNSAETVHLTNANRVPILSGTSLAGALRAQSHRILNLLLNDQQAVKEGVNNLFGQEMEDGDLHSEPKASRIWIREMPITGEYIYDRVQSRVKIDRFTSGSYPTALFDQQPVFKGKVKIDLFIENPRLAEVGLLMLLLKDLWTGDCPLGGEVSIGRGRLKGEHAEIAWKNQTWILIANADDSLDIEGDSAVLEHALQALREGI